GHSRPPPLGKRDPPRRYQPSRRRPQRKSAVKGATAAASPTWAGVIGSKPTAPTNTSPKNTSRNRARLRRKLTSGKRGDRWGRSAQTSDRSSATAAATALAVPHSPQNVFRAGLE